MKTFRDITGYVLGGVMFVVTMAKSTKPIVIVPAGFCHLF